MTQPVHRQTSIGDGIPVCLLLAAVCLLLTALCPNISAATLRWTRQSSGTMAWLHAVFFLDQNRGWIAGSKGTLLATVDGGKNWQFKPRPSEDALRDIYFVDEQNGWLVCEKNVYDLKTRDEPITYLMNTSDGGATWKRINIRDADINTRLVRAVFTRKGRGWVFGEGGTLFQTSDGGETWHLSKLADAEGVRFTATSFVDNRLGWAVGSGGHVLRTINGGRTWEAQNTGVAVDLLDVKFLNALDGWAVGSEGTVIHTADGGLHWTAEPSTTTHPLERICFADRDHAWAVGFGGTIVAYTRTDGLRLKQ